MEVERFVPRGPPPTRAELAILVRGVMWDHGGTNLTGCPSVFVATDVPEVRVDAGFLVAVVDGTRGVRVASWCKDDRTALACEAWDPQYQQALAIKTQPSRAGRVPWSQLTWKNVYPLRIGARPRAALQGQWAQRVIVTTTTTRSLQCRAGGRGRAGRFPGTRYAYSLRR